MGKKSQTKDRGYITAAEWQTEWGGHKDKSKRPFRSLPFNCCAITFTPFQDPVSPTVPLTSYCRPVLMLNVSRVSLHGVKRRLS